MGVMMARKFRFDRVDLKLTFDVCLLAAILIVLLVLITSASGQEPWAATEAAIEVEQSQVTFQTADAAEIAEDGERVSILAEGLDPGREYGVSLHPVDVAVEWIEVHDSQEPFPPKVQLPYKPGYWIVRGKAGQVFWVSLRRGIAPPAWVEVKIEPTDGGDPEDPPPEDPPPGDYGAIEELSRERAAAMGDTATAANIRNAITAACDKLDAACESGTCPTLNEAKRQVVAAIDLAKKDGRKDWYSGWRVPMSEAINELGLTATPNYIAVMRAAVKGL